MASEESPIMLRVQSLHALLYCERLFYLEEVENLRLADAAVYAGRRLHVELERQEEGEWHRLELQSERLGLRGKVDCLRRRDGSYIPYEHKRGRAAQASFDASPARAKASAKASSYAVWRSDRVQVVAYAMLIEEATGQTIPEARVRYHLDNVTVKIPLDEAARQEVLDTLARARQLYASLERPAVTTNERLCVKCSLAPACLPEEARRAATLTPLTLAKPPVATMEAGEAGEAGQTVAVEDRQMASVETLSATAAVVPTAAAAAPEATTTAAVAEPSPIGRAAAPRLFPADDKRQTLHVMTNGARVGRAGDQLEVCAPEAEKLRHPSREIGQVVLHGFSQITTQALRLCAEKEIAVHWLTQGGTYIGAFSSGVGCVQRRIRQYEALRDAAFRLHLTRRLAEAKVLSQLRFLLRASRDRDREDLGVKDAIEGMRRLLPALKRAATADEIRGVEGRAGALYFAALPQLIDAGIDERLRPQGRSRRPPRDPFNALLGFGYALLLKDVMSAILAVGLEPAFGFYHTPRSQAQPLALDLIELFRVAMVDLPIVASINRRQWDAETDFSRAGNQVWLADGGRRKLIELYERRKADEWKHPVLGYSLSYARLMELETRLLEKEWTGEPGLFARMRLR